jgi:hypothetical protein
MIHLQIIGTEIIYELPDDRTEEKAVADAVREWHHDTKILIIETNEVVERQDIFENKTI